MARIVLLEGYVELLNAFAGVLREAGHAVVATASESEAMAALSSGDVDLLVQNLMRPGLGGARFLRAMRNDPALAEIPVLIVSGDLRRRRPLALEDPDTGTMLPVQGWLQKPAMPDELLHAIRAVLAGGVPVRALAAPGLTLEPQVAAHAEEMFAVLSDPAIYEYENEPPASLEWLRERFTRLETRRSADGVEIWLNWVVRIPASGLIGFVQATVFPNGRADIAYVLASKYWGLGLASRAVGMMIDELVDRFWVRSLSATLKRANHRSVRLLERLEFAEATPDMRVGRRVAADELLMVRGA